MDEQACLKTGNLRIFSWKLVYLSSLEENTSPKSKNNFFSIDLITLRGIIKGRHGLGVLI
jgi:hypothetical protein